MDDKQLYTYKATCRRVVDGDTLDLDIDLGLKVHSHERVRLHGIDTPETYGVKKDSEEYAAGVKAKNRVEELLRPGGEPVDLMVETRKDKTGKYGRYLVLVWLVVTGEEFICLNEMLVTEGLAVHRSY